MRGRIPNKYYQYLVDDILSLVSNCPGASINEVAVKCGVGWATAKRYLDKLEQEGKILHRKKGKIKVYQRIGTKEEDSQ